MVAAKTGEEEACSLVIVDPGYIKFRRCLGLTVRVSVYGRLPRELSAPTRTGIISYLAVTSGDAFRKDCKLKIQTEIRKGRVVFSVDGILDFTFGRTEQ